jgi:predicted DsbA family dithiol-disulfide isomerase
MLTIYGDFNCPFSALASARADVLLARGTHTIEWRAIQHDTTIPAAGEPIQDDTAVAFAAEIATVLDLSEPDLHLRLIVPPVRSNTALASAAFAAAGDDAHRLRGRLFAAIWSEGRNLSNPAALRDLVDADRRGVAVAQRWQDEYDALPQPITPSLVLPDGYVSRGLGALARLAQLTTADPT